MFGICFASLLACLDSEMICNRGVKVNARQMPYRHNNIMMKAKYSIRCVPSARDQLPRKRLFFKDQNKMQLICTFLPHFTFQISVSRFSAKSTWISLAWIQVTVCLCERWCCGGLGCVSPILAADVEEMAFLLF